MWKKVLLNTEGDSLSEKIDALLSQQRESWPLFRDGEAALKRLVVKKYERDGSTVIVQANPARSVSTNAKVDPKSVSKRPCFLCPANIPNEERGISYGEYVALPNPFPILSKHLTVPLISHEPQALEGREADYLKLVKELGPKMLAFYNGPKCGASAPDHFHFQICSNDVPVFNELKGLKEGERVGVESFGRRFVVITSSDSEFVEDSIKEVVSTLKTLKKSSEEPLVNVVSTFREGMFKTLIFPRAAHRPSCYFAEGVDRLVVSPGALEMVGVFVISNLDDYDRVNEEVVHSVFDEVSLEKELFSKLVESL